MKTHKDLDVWNDGIKFVTHIYTTTSLFPKEEQFSLTSQIRRAAVSIPSNIAEGAARKSLNEFRQFLYIALGSSAELNTQLIISRNLNYLDIETFNNLLSELDALAKRLHGLIKYLDTKNK